MKNMECKHIKITVTSSFFTNELVVLKIFGGATATYYIICIIYNKK